MAVPEYESLRRQADIERTPQEFGQWTEELLKQITSTKEGKSAIRLRLGSAKQFIEEIYPLALWVARLYGNRSDIRCKAILGSQSHDAVISDSSVSPPRVFHVEVTLAVNGYEDHLRMLYMEQHGGVSAIGPVICGGTRANRKIEVPFEAMTHGVLIGEACQQVQDALKRKAAKPYVPGTVLLVMMNDAYFEFDQDFDELQAGLLEWVRGAAFAAIYVTGWQGRVAVELLPTTEGGEWSARSF